MNDNNHPDLDSVCREAEAILRECADSGAEPGQEPSDEAKQIARLHEKTGVSIEDARAALEACGWDLLDAVLYLERQGKLKPDTARHSTRADAEPEPEPEAEKTDFNANASHLLSLLKKLLYICNTNHLNISYKGREALSIPITVLIVLILCAHVVIPLALVAGLFFGLRYSVSGEHLGKQAVNDVMDKAANAAEHVRETVEDSLRKES